MLYYSFSPPSPFITLPTAFPLARSEKVKEGEEEEGDKPQYQHQPQRPSPYLPMLPIIRVPPPIDTLPPGRWGWRYESLVFFLVFFSFFFFFGRGVFQILWFPRVFLPMGGWHVGCGLFGRLLY